MGCVRIGDFSSQSNLRYAFIMPIYEYRCTGCSKEFELAQKITDEPASVCPNCGGKVERLVSATSFSLKGSGWYKDGYASKKSESAKKEVKKETKAENKNKKKDT